MSKRSNCLWGESACNPVSNPLLNLKMKLDPWMLSKTTLRILDKPAFARSLTVITAKEYKTTKFTSSIKCKMSSPSSNFPASHWAIWTKPNTFAPILPKDTSKFLTRHTSTKKMVQAVALAPQSSLPLPSAQCQGQIPAISKIEKIVRYTCPQVNLAAPMP